MPPFRNPFSGQPLAAIAASLGLGADDEEHLRPPKELENLLVPRSQAAQHQPAVARLDAFSQVQKTAVECRVDGIDQAQVDDERPALRQAAEHGVLDLPE